MNQQKQKTDVFERMKRLDDMLELTRAVQERVEAGDWEMASTLESQRRPLVERFFSVSPTPEEEERAREVLTEMLDINNRVIGLAQHLQRSLAMKTATINAGRKALRAYTQHGA